MAGIYIHIPYCKTRCIYCDFFTRTDMSQKSSFIDSVCSEIVLRKSYLGNELIETIYFGGGTPSQFSESDFKAIFEAIYEHFEVAENVEITLEANPDDLTASYLNMLNTLPFNRISIGIQSFDDQELVFLNRRHSAKKAIDAVEASKGAGFQNISIDLMYGLPNQTMAIWKRNLEQAIALDVQHISSYHLIYEQGTKLYRLLNKGEVKSVDEELSVDMFSVMIDELEKADFTHYEISNFAKNNLYSRHNTSYWLGTKYLGLGPAAHSYDGLNRAWNISSIPKYIESVRVGEPLLELEVSDSNTRYNDFILTGMRTMWGVDLNELEVKFGANMLNYALDNVKKYINQGYVIHENNKLKLTKQGIFISDGIMSELMYID